MSDTMGAGPPVSFTQSSDPYVLVGRAQIAADWTDLIDGEIDAPIDRDETGTLIGDVIPRAWTGTDAMGTSVTPCCVDWGGTAAGAGTGSTAAVDGTWSFISGLPCNEVARLYCFEQ